MSDTAKTRLRAAASRVARGLLRVSMCWAGE